MGRAALGSYFCHESAVLTWVHFPLGLAPEGSREPGEASVQVPPSGSLLKLFPLLGCCSTYPARSGSAALSSMAICCARSSLATPLSNKDSAPFKTLAASIWASLCPSVLTPVEFSNRCHHPLETRAPLVQPPAQKEHL